MSLEQQMQEAEDLCAKCDKACVESLQYPDNIMSKIDRAMVLQGSANIFRWHIIYCSGVSSTRWPKDIVVPDSYAEVLDTAIKQHIPEKVRLSAITRNSEDGSNPEEATDIIIFPEHIKYRSVTRDQIPLVIKYHTQVIAPRYQQALRSGSTPNESTPITTVVLSKATQEEFLSQAQNVIPSDDISAFFELNDYKTHGAGTAFPLPCGIPNTTTWVFLCGHKLRDNRCGVTAPILQEQFCNVFDEKYPELNDRVEIDLVSHVGGHKVAGNVIIHDRTQTYGSVFYGRVEPKHVEAIVDETIIKGELLAPIVRACHQELW